jgi:hypothetical protein
MAIKSGVFGEISEMKTFTVRDLDRQPNVVLKTCEREGRVRIRARNGQTFTIQPEQPRKPKISFTNWLDEIDRRRRRLFPKPMTRRQAEQLDRLLTSEDRLL